MKRREFIRNTALTLAAVQGVPSAALMAATDNMARIGCCTSTFHNRFASTRRKGTAPSGPDFNLLDMPAMFVEKLGIRNVELWSKHFPEATIAFGEKMRAAAAKAGARIINVPQDEEPFELTSLDAEKRKACLKVSRQWMDIAAACGAPSSRANVGGRAGKPLNLPEAVDSFRQLAEYGEKIGVKILVENHGGASLTAENVVAIVKGVNSPWCRSLVDSGNSPGALTQEQRIAYLEQMLPLAYLVSAKGMVFDDNYNHISYDVGACVRAAEKAGFKGIYSIELWDRNYVPADPIRAVKVLTGIIQQNL